jgi:hypothetical protein
MLDSYLRRVDCKTPLLICAQETVNKIRSVIGSFWLAPSGLTLAALELEESRPSLAIEVQKETQPPYHAYGWVPHAM